MFGLSSVELLFCTLLALLVIGPRDLPGVVRSIGQVVVHFRRVYQDMVGGVAQLEREIHRSDNPDTGKPAWLEFLPEDIRELQNSIQPHGNDPQATAGQYRTVKAAVAKARKDYAASLTTVDRQDVQ